MDYAATILARLPGASARRGTGIKQLIETLDGYLPADQIAPVAEAYKFGAEAHEGQTRMSGEPYISHPVAVAQILANMHMDSQTITAAILHDVIEDTETPVSELAELFGTDVANLVDGVSKLDQIHFTSQR